MAKKSFPIEKINALAELNRLGWKYEPAGQNEFRILCPSHKDTNPSASLNVEKNVWICHSCKAQGDIVSLLATILQQPRGIVLHELCDRYGLSEYKTISPTAVDRFHAAIWGAGSFLQELYKRGITDDDIREARLGYSKSDGRIAIPVYDADWNIVNIRRYLPGAPGPEKMRNTPGYGGSHIYQISQLEKFETIWLCGGELKALVLNKFLNSHKIGAVAITAGETNWSNELIEKFEKKNVFICYDIDETGIKCSRLLARYLTHKASSVSIIRLPLDKKRYPKGDINDYIGQEHAGEPEILALMENAEKFILEASPVVNPQEENEAPIQVSLLESTHYKCVGKKVEIHALITAMDTNPFIVPKEIICDCTLNQKNCAVCPVFRCAPDKTDRRHLFIHPTSPGILEMVNSSKRLQEPIMRDALGIPPCKSVTFEIVSHYNVLDVRLVPKLTITQDHSDNIVQPALIIGHGIEMNAPYIFRGRPFPHPKNQQAILLLNEVETDKDSLSSFEPTSEDLENLKIFQPSSWSLENLQLRLDCIYSDLEANITRIYKRRSLHLIIDLTYHSVLLIPFDDDFIKGWINTIVVGDSSQGKSEATIKLKAHYKLGERVECKNASVAGLLGGLNQIGNRWFVAWGVIPTHDRRLVVLEEVKGTSQEVLGRLTDMRSSGIAEIPKIEKRRTWARTRLLFITNPRSDRPVAAYNFGIETIAELIGHPEDIRRFDAALVMSNREINPTEINELSRKRPEVEHMFTSDLCNKLVLWAWTRKNQQVIFENDAVEEIFDSANMFCSKYSEEFPLVDRGTMKHKLARLSASLAARTFSTEDGVHLIVRKCHVLFITDFLNSIYSSDVFGYNEFSKAQRYSHSVIDPNLIEKHIKGTKFPKDLVENLLIAKEITLDDICDWCDLDRDNGKTMLSFLVRKHALKRVKTGYYKTQGFIEFLRNLKEAGIENKTELSNSREEF